ncbi:MAG: YtxH domain-containing protein [Chitinophagaceae bacterium]
MGLKKILAGMIIGVAVGVLIAPASGSETRQKIADTTDNLKRKWRRLRRKASTELDTLKGILENEVEGLKDDVRQKVLLLIDESKKGYDEFDDLYE